MSVCLVNGSSSSFLMGLALDCFFYLNTTSRAKNETATDRSVYPKITMLPVHLRLSAQGGFFCAEWMQFPRQNRVQIPC